MTSLVKTHHTAKLPCKVGSAIFMNNGSLGRVAESDMEHLEKVVERNEVTSKWSPRGVTALRKISGID